MANKVKPVIPPEFPPLGPVPDSAKQYGRQPSHCEPYDPETFKKMLKGYNDPDASGQ